MSKKKKKQKDDNAKLIFSKSLQEVEKSSKKKKKKKAGKKEKKEKKEKATIKLSSCKIKQTETTALSYKDALESEHKLFFVTPKNVETSKLNYHVVIKMTNNSLVDIASGESITAISKKCGEKEWRDNILLYPASVVLTKYEF